MISNSLVLVASSNAEVADVKKINSEAEVCGMSRVFMKAALAEAAEEIETTVYNLSIILGGETGLRIADKINQYLTPFVAQKMTEALAKRALQEIFKICREAITTSLLPAGSGPLVQPLIQQYVEQPATSRIMACCKPCFKLLGQTAQFVAKPFAGAMGKFSGRVTGKIVANQYIDGKIAKLIKDTLKLNENYYQSMNENDSWLTWSQTAASNCSRGLLSMSGQLTAGVAFMGVDSLAKSRLGVEQISFKKICDWKVNAALLTYQGCKLGLAAGMATAKATADFVNAINDGIETLDEPVHI